MYSSGGVNEDIFFSQKKFKEQGSNVGYLKLNVQGRQDEVHHLQSDFG